MENNINRDEFIRKLVSQQIPDKAPDGFTGRVMEKINPSLGPAREHILSPIAWGGIFIGIDAAIITMIFVDIPFISNFFSTTGFQKISMDIFSTGFYNSFIKFFKELNINAIGIAIVIGFITLIAIERIITRRRTQQGLVLL